MLLGGDVSVHLVHREADANELAFLKARGRVSETISMRAMAYALKNGREEERQLIELKAVDGAYPLYGSVGLCAAEAAGAGTRVQCFGVRRGRRADLARSFAPAARRARCASARRIIA